MNESLIEQDTTKLSFPTNPKNCSSCTLGILLKFYVKSFTFQVIEESGCLIDVKCLFKMSFKLSVIALILRTMMVLKNCKTEAKSVGFLSVSCMHSGVDNCHIAQNCKEYQT